MKTIIVLCFILLGNSWIYSQELSKKEIKALKSKFEEIEFGKVSASLIPVAKSGKWGLANVNNHNIVIECKYQEISGVDIDYYTFRGKINGTWDLYNARNGERISYGNYEDMLANFAGLIGALKNGKWGYIDNDGNLKIDFKFDQIDVFSGNNLARGFVYVTYEGERRKMNIKGEFID